MIVELPDMYFLSYIMRNIQVLWKSTVTVEKCFDYMQTIPLAVFYVFYFANILNLSLRPSY